MQKPASLRAAITAILPELGRDADRLKLWVEKGRIRSPMTPDRGFAWEYTLNLVITDFTDHPSLVFLTINDWLRAAQPDLLTGRDAGYSFEADIIDDNTIDLAIEIALTEQVVLRPRAGGGFNLEHLAEPDPLFPEAVPIEPPALLQQIWWKDELLVE